MALIDRLRVVAEKGHFLKPPATLLAMVSAGLFIYEIVWAVGGYEDDIFLIPAATLFLWSMSISLFLSAFANVPVNVEEKLGWFKRFKLYCVRFYYYFLAVLLIASTCGVLFTTNRFIHILQNS